MVSVTLGQAQVAGTIAAKINQLQRVVAELNAAIDGGGVAKQLSATVLLNNQIVDLSVEFDFDADATKAILSGMVQNAQALIAGLNAQLADVQEPGVTRARLWEYLSC